jgi:hypothetical protein
LRESDLGFSGVNGDEQMIANNPGIDYYLIDPSGTLWARRYEDGSTDKLAIGLDEDRDFYKKDIPLIYYFNKMKGVKNEDDLYPDQKLDDYPKWNPPMIPRLNRPFKPLDEYKNEPPNIDSRTFF